MTKVDPIIAVKEIKTSADWYEKIFGFKNAHGGNDFAVLVTEADEVIICLHKWAAHGHPSLTHSDKPSGNGLLLYFRTDDLEDIRERVEENGEKIEEELHSNPNSLRKEFSLRDPDGYYLTVTEYHEYEG